MGVDLKGELSNFTISREDFLSLEEGGDGSVEYGCIKKGNHRVLRFDMITYNIGDQDLMIGDPRDPDVEKKYFRHKSPPELTEGLGYQFRLQPFFVYSLRNDNSTVKLSGYKEAFCFDGLDPMSCYNQGLAAKSKKSDVYSSDMACQFVVIDDLADGEYTLEATVNAPSVESIKNGNGEVLFEEDNYDNNTVAVRLQIKDDKVTEIK
jgi:hypothetical protein